MSNIKKIATIVSAIAIVLLLYTISTFIDNDDVVPAVVNPAGFLSEDTENSHQNSSTVTTNSSAFLHTSTSNIVSSITQVPDNSAAAENKPHVIVPFSKLPGKEPPARINPVPVVTPYPIVFKSIPLICHDTDIPTDPEETTPEPDTVMVTESTVINTTEPPITSFITDTPAVVIPSDQTITETQPIITNE